MKFILLLLLPCLVAIPVLAQKQTYDLVHYTPPKGWKKEEKQNIIVYSQVDNKTGAWCQIGITKSTNSKGTIDEDFNSEWQELVVKSYGVKEAPQLSEVEEENGWRAKGGSGKFKFNNRDAVVMLTTMSGYQRCASIVATTNDQSFINAIQELLGSVDMNTPNGNTTIIKTTEPSKNTNNIAIGRFHFTSTNFDDGWTSTVQEDWVEVTKGNIKVLLHYPRQGTIYPSDPEPLINNAWNVLVAPRYRDLKNYKVVSTSLSYDRAYLASGNVTDMNGKNVFVVMYRVGNTGWMEFISPDKNSFNQSFQISIDAIDYSTSNSYMEPMAKMASYNKFAVAAADLDGSWTNDFTGMQEFYSVYTGQHVATNMYQSSEIFDFFRGTSYNWHLIVINGGAGKFNDVKNSGKLSVPNNWQISFSNMEGKPKTYDAYFSCIKGARILWMKDSKINSGYTSYGLRK